jgi:hypothetical protein
LNRKNPFQNKMGIFSKGPVYSQKSMGYRQAKNSPVMKKILADPDIARELRDPRARDEFYHALKGKEGGGVTKTELQEVFGHFAQGHGRHISSKRIYKIAKKFFPSSSDRYKYTSGGGSDFSSAPSASGGGGTTATKSVASGTQANAAGNVQSNIRSSQAYGSIVAPAHQGSSGDSQGAASDSGSSAGESSDKSDVAGDVGGSSEFGWFGKYSKANIKSNIILKGEASPHQVKPLKKALSREEIMGIKDGDLPKGSFGRALKSTLSKK